MLLLLSNSRIRKMFCLVFHIFSDSLLFYHHHHKHPGLGNLTRSVSRVTSALSIASSVSQLFSFLVGCRGMIYYLIITGNKYFPCEFYTLFRWMWLFGVLLLLPNKKSFLLFYIAVTYCYWTTARTYLNCSYMKVNINFIVQMPISFLSSMLCLFQQ